MLGGSKFQTDNETLESHKNGISLRSLPRNFRDIIQIAQALGVRYLWIDGLCILQGSKEDWEIELGKTADIYSNSYLTVATTCAASVDTELFSSPEQVATVGPIG